jgi:hypothetical protein
MQPGAKTGSGGTGQPMTVPPALFRAASNSVADVENQRVMHERYMKLFEGLVDGIVAAWSQFHVAGLLTGVAIQGQTATGGKVICPDLEPLVYAGSAAAGNGRWEVHIRQQVAKAFWSCWKRMLEGMRVPGLPWYPSFAAWHGPAAPPTPNVPTPIASLILDPAAMTVANLKPTLANALQGCMEFHAEFSEAVASGIETAFQTWKLTTMVTKVLGSGPVPTFAPPAVPSGPVAGGVGNMAPGGFV